MGLKRHPLCGDGTRGRDPEGQNAAGARRRPDWAGPPTLSRPIALGRAPDWDSVVARQRKNEAPAAKRQRDFPATTAGGVLLLGSPQTPPRRR